MTCILKITYFSETTENSANGSISTCDETNSRDENSAGSIESPLGKNDTTDSDQKGNHSKIYL